MKRATQTAALLLCALLLAFGHAVSAHAQVTTSAVTGRVTNEQARKCLFAASG